MYKVAILEDEQADALKLGEMIKKYGEETGTVFEIVYYQNAVVFLTGYKANYDIIFMDIEMPHLNGMECAARLRRIDQTTLLIFVTNMGNMAAMGYEIEAFDFVVKPINYELMRLKLNRAVDKLSKQQGEKILIQSDRAYIEIYIKDIYYIEVYRHQLTYHTFSGNYIATGTMSQLRKKLEPFGFSSCNNCYLVNLKYVQKVQGFWVTVNGEQLQISHPRKKEFMEMLNNYIGI